MHSAGNSSRPFSRVLRAGRCRALVRSRSRFRALPGSPGAREELRAHPSRGGSRSRRTQKRLAQHEPVHSPLPLEGAADEHFPRCTSRSEGMGAILSGFTIATQPPTWVLDQTHLCYTRGKLHPMPMLDAYIPGRSPAPEADRSCQPMTDLLLGTRAPTPATRSLARWRVSSSPPAAVYFAASPPVPAYASSFRPYGHTPSARRDRRRRDRRGPRRRVRHPGARAAHPPGRGTPPPPKSPSNRAGGQVMPSPTSSPVTASRLSRALRRTTTRRPPRPVAADSARRATLAAFAHRQRARREIFPPTSQRFVPSAAAAAACRRAVPDRATPRPIAWASRRAGAAPPQPRAIAVTAVPRARMLVRPTCSTRTATRTRDPNDTRSSAFSPLRNAGARCSHRHSVGPHCSDLKQRVPRPHSNSNPCRLPLRAIRLLCLHCTNDPSASWHVPTDPPSHASDRSKPPLPHARAGRRARLSARFFRRLLRRQSASGAVHRSHAGDTGEAVACG